MKTWIALSLLCSGTVSAQVTDRAGESYSEYSTSIRVSNGESKTVVLKVNPQVRVDRFGDPEIPSHGHYDYVITGSVVESGKTCSFEALLAQADGEALTTDELRATGRDRSDSIRLCSGLILNVQSVRALLNTADSKITLNSPGLNIPIGEGVLRFVAKRTVEEPRCPSDPWHCD